MAMIQIIEGYVLNDYMEITRNMFWIGHGLIMKGIFFFSDFFLHFFGLSFLAHRRTQPKSATSEFFKKFISSLNESFLDV